MIHNILLPFDGSHNSIKVLDFFKDLVFKLETKVLLLNFFNLPSILLMKPYKVSPDVLNSMDEKLKIKSLLMGSVH